MSVTGGIMAGVGLAGSIGSAAIQGNAATEAAQTQATAAEQAQQLQAQEAQNALDFQKQQWQTTQANEAPWLQAGQTGLKALETDLGLGGNTNTPGYGSLVTPFTPPTLSTAEQYPGYQFGLQQGELGITNSAAAQGNLVSGNALEAANNFAQNFAQQDYGNVYNQAFNTFETNQSNLYNRLAGISGTGQMVAQNLGSLGQTAANNYGNISLTTGAQQGQDIQNAAAATASGYIGGANAWGGALSSGTNNLVNMALISQLLNNGGGSNLFTDPGTNVLQPSYMPGGGNPVAPSIPGVYP